ncbi:hypothetical protein [Longispora urticae]
MSTAPLLTGQVIGQTALAIFAVRDRVLARAGITFHQSVALTTAAAAGGSVDRAAVLDRMTGTLQIGEPAAVAVLAELVDAGLVRDTAGVVTLTDAGRGLDDGVRAEFDEITSAVYGDLSEEDRATAGRLLVTVTARANALLANL